MNSSESRLRKFRLKKDLFTQNRCVVSYSRTACAGELSLTFTWADSTNQSPTWTVWQICTTVNARWQLKPGKLTLHSKVLKKFYMTQIGCYSTQWTMKNSFRDFFFLLLSINWLLICVANKQTNKKKNIIWSLKKKKNAIVSNFIKIIQVVRHLRLKNTSHGSAVIYLYMCRMSNKHT